MQSTRLVVLGEETATGWVDSMGRQMGLSSNFRPPRDDRCTRPSPLPQVGFGLLQFICGLGALGGAGTAVEPPVGLDSLLGQYGLLAGSPRVAGGGEAAAVGSQPEETGGFGGVKHPALACGSLAQQQ